MVLIKNLTQSQINGVVDNFRGEVITNADTSKLMFNTGTEFTYLVYSDLNNVITGLAGVEATNLTGTLQTAAQPNVTSLGTLTGLTVNNNLSLPQHNGIDKGLTLGGELVTSSAEQLNYVNTTPGTAEANKALVLDENLSIVGLSNLETDNLTVNGTLVTSSAIELNYVDVDTLGVAQASKALVVDADRNITNINTLEADFIQVNGTLVTSSAIELNYVDVDTLGIAQASKALVVDANRNITNLNNVEAVNLTGTLQTAAQPNITSVGDLTGLNVDGVASVDSLIVNGVPLDAFKLNSLKMRVYSTPDFSGRVIKADIVSSVDFTDYEPAPGVTENYSMEVWGYIKPLYSESYTFTVTSNDKFRLWVNNEMVRADWTEGDDTNLQTVPIALTADKWYPIYIQHSQLTGTEKLSLRWSSASQVSEIIPSSAVAYDDKALPITARKTYTQDSINLYDSANTTLSSIAVNTSGDMTITSASNIVNVAGHNGVDQGLKLNNVLVTSTAAELNYVDTTVGVAAANKAVVLNADKDYVGIRNMTTVGNMGVNTTTPSKQVEINSATGDVLRLARDAANGSAVNYADMTIDADGKLTINSSGNETLIHSTDNFNVAGHDGSSIGLKLANVLVTATADELNYVDTTPGNAEASKALVLNSSRDISNINNLSTSTLASTSTDDSTSVTTGAIKTAGGVGIAKNLNVGGVAEILNTTNATNADSGALVVTGGAGIKKALYVGEEGASVTTSVTTGDIPLGTNWTDITPSNVSKTDNAWLGTAWSESVGRFVVVGSSLEGNNILHSTNGSSWSKVGVGKMSGNVNEVKGVFSSPGSDSHSWFSIAYNGTKYVAISNSSSSVTTSSDGVNWTVSSSPGSFRNVIWVPELSLFVAAGDGLVATSPDGTSWTQRTTPFTSGFMNIAWSPTLNLLVILTSAGWPLTSSDGITWTSGTVTAPPSGMWYDLKWIGGTINKFVAVCFHYSGTAGTILTSSNGTSWASTSVSSVSGLRHIAWSPTLNKILVVSQDNYVTSTNGSTWSVSNVASGYLGPAVWSSSLNRFVIVGTQALLTSTDGTTWLSFTSTNYVNTWRGITEGSSGNVLAVADSGANRLLTITTNTSPDVASSEMFDVVYASGMNKYVAIGRYSYGPDDNFFHAATSSNGTGWTYHENAATVDAGTSAIYYNTNFLQMAYSSTLNRLVVVGTNIILHSTNGTNWTEIRLTNRRFNDVIWAAGTINKFIAIGENGLYSTSSDGINWTHNTHSSNDYFETIAYSPTLNKFILKGISGSYSSTDATTFTLMLTLDETPIPQLDSATWKDMQWVDETSQFVAVGFAHSKSLITSSDGVTWTSYTGIPNVDYEDFVYAPSLDKMIAVSRNDNNVRIVQSTFNPGTTTTTTTTTTADGYFNLKGDADIIGGIDVTGVVNMNNTTDSTSTSTGALVVDGGVGIAKSVNVGETLTVTGNTTLSANVEVDGPSLRIPVGNTAARPTGELGQVRYNSETSQFEGFGAGNTWGSLGGVTDVDQDTKILAETSAGADNDELRFYNAGAESMRLTNVGLLGLGTSAPAKKLEINSATGDVLRMTYNDADGSAVNYADMTISSDGKLTINSSGNETLIHSSDSFNVVGHNGSNMGLKLGDVLVTSTAAELNYVDTTPGTAEASKALVLNSSRNIANINNISATGNAVVTGTTTTSGVVLSSSETGAFDPNAFSNINMVSGSEIIRFYDYVRNEGVTGQLSLVKLSGQNITYISIPRTFVDTYISANGYSSMTIGSSYCVPSIARDGTIIASCRFNGAGGTYCPGLLKGTETGFTAVMQTLPLSPTANTVIYKKVAVKSSTNFLYVHQGTVYYTTDGGSTFNQSTTTFTGLEDTYSATCEFFYDSNLYIIANTVGIWTSPTGEIWTAATTPSGGRANVYYNGSIGKYFAFTVGNSSLWQSTNGTTWTSVTLPSLGGMLLGSICNNNHNGVFAIYPSNPATSKNLLYTLDGTTWQTTLLTIANDDIPGVGWLQVKNNGAVFSNNILYYNVVNYSQPINGWRFISTGVINSVSSLFKLNYLTGGYLANQSKTGYQWYSSSTDASVGNKIMELDNTLSITVPESLENTTDSTTTTTGALTVAGGVGIAKSVNIGQNLNVDGNVDVDGPSLRIPVGNTAARPTGQLGQVRYNSETSQFEGFGAGNTWGSLGGVTDVDQDTKILAETSAGADNDELRFYNAGSESMRLTNTGLLGLGTSAPSKQLEINSATGDVLRMTYNDTDGSAVNYVDMSVSSSGNLTINSVGETTFIHDTNNLDIAGHNGSTKGLKLAGVLVTSTATELNYVDTTPGSAEASKALVVNSSRNISNINVLSTSNLTAVGTDDSTSVTTGAITTAGGVGIAKNLNVGGIAKVTNLTNSTSADSGALQVLGGAGIKKALYVGDNAGNTVVSNPDGFAAGTTWVNRSSSNAAVLDQNWRAVEWSPTLGLYAAVSMGYSWSNETFTSNILTSTDGIAWTSTAAVAGEWHDIKWISSLNKFVAIGKEFAGFNEFDEPDFVKFKVMTSADGISWTGVSNPTTVDGQTHTIYDSIQQLSMTQSSNKLVVVGGSIALSSTDGNTWVETRFTNKDYRDVAWSSAQSKFVAVGNNSEVAYSADGVSWTHGVMPETGETISTVEWSSDLNKFIALSQLFYFTSTNGTTWTATQLDSNQFAIWSDLQWISDLSKFVAVGENTRLTLTSADGVSWSVISGNLNTNFVDFAYSSTLKRIVGVSRTDDDARLAYSDDTLFITTQGSSDGYFNLKGKADVIGDMDVTGVVTVENTTQSTSSTNGAVVVAGGVGIAKNLNVGQEMVVSGDTTLSANVDVDGPSLRIPVGNTAARPVGVAGQIRYNSETSQFEGFGAGNAWGSLGGVTDVDQDTKILAETAAGDDNDELRFYNAGSETMRLTNVGLMGLGTSAPAKKLEINSATGDVLRMTYNDADGSAVNYADMTISADGKLTINSSGDETIIHSSDNFNVAGHNGSTLGLKLAGVLVTSTAVELNYVDTTPGAAEASKALVLDSSRDINNINVLSADTINVTTFSAQDLSAENINTTGNVGINTSDLTFGLQINETSGNVLRLTYNDNSTSTPLSKADFTMDDSNNLSITAANSVNIAVHNGTDKGLKLAGVLVTSTAAELNYVDTTPGTAEASKALVLNSSKDIVGINSISMNNLNLTYDSAVADTQGSPLTIMRTTSGTPANGLGVGVDFKIENSVNSNVVFGSVGVVSADITSASEDGHFVVNLMTAGVMTESLRLSNSSLFVTELQELSDQRLKENITIASLQETHERVMKLELVDYNYINKQKTHRGLLAQAVEKVIPSAVEISERDGLTDCRTVSTREITNHLLGSVQYLSNKLDEMMAKFEQLHSEFEVYKQAHP